MQKRREPVCQLLFLLQLRLALLGFRGQLPGQLINTGLKSAVGISDLSGHLIKQLQRCPHSLIVLLREQRRHLVIDIGSRIGRRLC